jgi:hypothetical protein
MDEITWARCLFLGFFGLLLAGVLWLPKEYIFRGAPDRARWRDLRLWAIVLVLIHIYVYWLL